MADIEIRKANAGDWRVIREIQKKDGFPHAYYIDEERVRTLMNRGEVFFLAAEDGRPAGFASIDFEIRATLHFLSVMESAQGKGVGSSLLKALIDEAKGRKYMQIITFTEKDGSNLNNFLKKRGFEEVGYQKDRYGKGKDAIIMSLGLGP